MEDQKFVSSISSGNITVCLRATQTRLCDVLNALLECLKTTTDVDSLKTAMARTFEKVGLKIN